MDAPLDWHAVEKDILQHGFLADSMSAVRDHFLTDKADWFQLSRDLNGQAQSFYVEQTDRLKGLSALDPFALGLQLMVRALYGFQGAIRLLEFGMTIEAKSLVRHIYEAAFWIGYLNKKPSEAVAHLQHASLKGEAGVFRSLKEELFDLGDLQPTVALHLSELEAARDKYPGAPTIEQIATMAGYERAYSIYRHLCGGAAHASLTSVLGFLSRDDEGAITGHQIGPDDEGMPDAFNVACFGLILTMEVVANLSGSIDHPRFETVRTLHDRLMELSG